MRTGFGHVMAGSARLSPTLTNERSVHKCQGAHTFRQDPGALHFALPLLTRSPNVAIGLRSALVTKNVPR